MPKTFIFKKALNKKAFSLIELSIVLVIIGLLIVGITSGRNLVKSSKLSSARSVTLSSQIVTIPGMVLWVEPTTKDSFLNTESINSSQLTTWYNLEPSGFLVKNNLTTSASSNVVYKEVGINDLPDINTTITGNMSLTNFSGSALTASTIVIVFKPTGTVSGTLMDAGSGNSTSSISISTTQVTLNAGSSAASSASTNPASFAANTSYILMVYFNGSSSKVFVNNTTEVGGSGATLSAGTNTLNGITIGANKSGASGIAAEISEVIVYNRVLKSTERQDVMGYLSKKYKISVTGLP